MNKCTEIYLFSWFATEGKSWPIDMKLTLCSISRWTRQHLVGKEQKKGGRLEEEREEGGEGEDGGGGGRHQGNLVDRPFSGRSHSSPPSIPTSLLWKTIMIVSILEDGYNLKHNWKTIIILSILDDGYNLKNNWKTTIIVSILDDGINLKKITIIIVSILGDGCNLKRKKNKL